MVCGNPAWHASLVLVSLPRLMTRLPIIVAAALFSFLICGPARAQQEDDFEIKSLQGGGTGVFYEARTGIARGTNGVFINYHGTVLTADSVAVNKKSGEAMADGKVHIQQGDQLWVGEHVQYNFNTHNMVSEQFRSG